MFSKYVAIHDTLKIRKKNWKKKWLTINNALLQRKQQKKNIVGWGSSLGLYRLDYDANDWLILGFESPRL